MRRSWWFSGALVMLMGCHAPYREFEPPDRTTMMPDRNGNIVPAPTPPAWSQQPAVSPLAYRSSPPAEQMAPSSIPTRAQTASAPGRLAATSAPLPPSPVARASETIESVATGRNMAAAPKSPIRPVSYETPSEVLPPPRPPLPGQPRVPLLPVTAEQLAKQERSPETPSPVPGSLPPLPDQPVPVPSPELADKSEKREKMEKKDSTETAQAEPNDKVSESNSSPTVRMVNSKRILLNYELKDVGPSGVAGVDLYVTRDGKDWKKEEKSTRSGPPYVVEVDEEGTYGFTLVARSGLGRGRKPPRPGEQPQVWVEVDLTSPVVKITEVKQGMGNKVLEVTIHWTASDRNLSRRPVTLSYAEKPEGPWTPLAANIENTGSYVWQVPAKGPTQFHLKAEVIDLVGNVGSAQSSRPILIDMSEPRVSILAVEPAGK